MITALVISVLLNIALIGFFAYLMYTPDSHWGDDDLKEHILNPLRPLKYRRPMARTQD